MNVIVLGAGITGVSSAWFLRQAGFDVTVVDRQPEAALETSFANGGQISVSQSEPWANPGAPLKVLKWLWREDSPLLFRPRLELRQWLWGARFLRECMPSAHRRNIVSMVNLGLYSRDTLRALRADTGIEYDQLSRGILQLYFDRASLDAAAEATELMREFGCERYAIDPERAIAIEPALAGQRGRLVGAVYAADDESGDARKFTQALAARAAEQGVEFRYNTCIRALEHEDGAITGVKIRDCEGREAVLRADHYLLCMGSYSPLLAAPLGLYLPIYPTKGYSATLSTEGFEGAPTVSLTDDGYKMVYTRLGERIRIAGTAELDGYSTELNDVRCEALTRRYFELFPNSADPNSVQYWTGLRPSTPSNVPLIGRTRYRNLFLNTGHGTLGWTEGPGSGRAVAEIIAGRQPELAFDFCEA
ncbi:D-amino acid dehydrogenase [Chitinimonas koreensis]|uniref:D-amino acid dehydrogenase n=1 Tax=Chitinimonas koreensis TaxID=356302 RepID=UPI0004141D0F|nr:D-amino acid dehydrogenase [Chitinimonas koreensis]QNM95039.1 D-amino acid dehydrogenase [Chitinimonas koreensis]